MARLNQVFGGGIGSHSRFDSECTVGGRNACGHAFSGFNGDRESCAVNGSIAGGHGRQFEVFATLAGEGEANEAAAKAGHEVDGLCCDVVGGNKQVAFVFAIFVVHHDDDATGAQVSHNVFYRRNLYRRQGTARIRRHVTTFKKTCQPAGLA